MKQRSDLPYLLHILDAIDRIEQYVQGLDRATFDENLLVQDGVIRQLMVIGEAVKLLSDDLRAKHTDVPWSRIARMRDRLVHHYFGIDIETVWLTVQDDLPVLKTEIEAIRADMGSSPPDRGQEHH
jgi:uncharacterized protein with HEPN domain